MPEPTTAPSTPPKPQCTAITTDGNRCRNTVIEGLHLCYAHYHHRFPALADPDHISIPLLEDGASIRLLMTQVAHGLLSKKLDPVRARTTIWAAQVAASTMPRPPRLKAPADPEPPGEPVHRIAFDHESMICADGDLSDRNHLCSAPATPEELWAAQDTVLSVNQPVPEQRYTDPWHPAPPPQPIPDQYNVLPPPEPEPRPNHERGLPCECPKCLARREVFLGQFRRPRKKPEPVDNPLCPSGKPTCLGPDSEFCCRACRRLRNPPHEDPDADQDPLSMEAKAAPSPVSLPLCPVPCALCPAPCPLPPAPCTLHPGPWSLPQGNTSRTVPTERTKQRNCGAPQGGGGWGTGLKLSPLLESVPGTIAVVPGEIDLLLIARSHRARF